MPRNNAKGWVIVSVCLAILGFGMTMAGFALDDSNFYWMIMVGLMLGITFFICIFVFLAQAKRLSRMFSRDELLVHWQFDTAEQAQKAKTEYLERKKLNRMLLIIITVFFVLIGGGFAVFGFDDAQEAMGFLLVMLGVLAVIAIVALTAPGATYRRMLKAIPEVYVGPFGAWVMGEYVQWKAPMTRIIRVVLIAPQGDSLIEVHYEILQRYGYQQQVQRIPVPSGRQLEARAVAMQIASVNGVAYSEA